MAASLEQVRFLLVDDNVHMMNIVKAMLRGYGAVEVFEAKTVEDAVERLKRSAPDIMILDYQMAEEDGVAFIRRLRTDPDSPAPYIPVIMLTAHADRARVVAARDAGVNAFCAKPVTAVDLMKKIAAVIDDPRPFVRSDGYAGPDRRRQDALAHAGPERRADRQPKS